MEYVELHGERVPKVGLGTWAMRGRACYQAVLGALEMGYRHLDTAQMYANERQVGHAIADSGLRRDELFVVSKVRSSNLGYQDVVDSGHSSREQLGLEQLDLYLVHWPNARFPIEETMRGMNELISQGVTRLVGVSNFSVAEFKDAQAASEARLFTNQVPYYVGHPQPQLLPYCQQNQVLLTAYSPVAKGRLAGDQQLRSIGEPHGATAAQVALRWLIQQELVVTIPKSSDPGRQRENFEVFDFELSDEQMQALAAR